MVQWNDAAHPGEVFADGIGWIGFHGGVVRIDFFSYGTPEAATAARAGKAPDQEAERVVGPPPAMPTHRLPRSPARAACCSRSARPAASP